MQASPPGDCYDPPLRPLPPFQHSLLLQSKDQQERNRAILRPSHLLSPSQLKAFNSRLEQKIDLTKCTDLIQLGIAY